MNDIICARITPVGSAAISVLRISGPGAIELVAEHFKPATKLLKAKSHSIIFGDFTDDKGRVLDEVLVSVFRSPKSYTGEDTIELSCHGSISLTDRILGVLLLKARLANPGEFTLRAFLNGKLDLSRAEAVNDLVRAGTSRSETAALMQVKGYLSQHLQMILKLIQEARLRCELAIDFADQDLPQIDLAELGGRLDELLSLTNELYEEGSHGIKLREGLRLCLAGAPNVGKSSLFNALLKQNRAIVTDTAGTTRDYLEESFSLKGNPIILVDTAGLRHSDDQIEKEGILRSYELIKSADLILYLSDNNDDKLPDELEPFKERIVFIASKADLRAEADIPKGQIAISTVKPQGLKALQDYILDYLKLPDELIEKPLITNVRHLSALKKSIGYLKQAKEALKAELGFEFIAAELIYAAGALEDILGVVPTDELLGQIFENFCIGK